MSNKQKNLKDLVVDYVRHSGLRGNVPFYSLI